MANRLAEASGVECACSLRERLVGDGCQICNPKRALEIAHENTAELVERMRNWLAESAVSERITARRCREFLAICDEFSGPADL